MESIGVVGIDVSKARLDVAFRPSGKRLAVNNGTRGISRLVNLLKSAAPERRPMPSTRTRCYTPALPVRSARSRCHRRFAGNSKDS
jgi:hypothetical protein